MINRIVLFKFKPDVSEESINVTVDMAKMWDKEIDEVNNIQVVRNTIERSDNNYQVAFLMSFKQAVDIDAFSNHPLHTKFVEIILGQTVDIQVFDY